MTGQQIVKTGDGSSTLYSPDYDETYHSTNGALSEAFSKFCAPCRIAEAAKKGAVSILDVGFGLGYNILAALHLIKNVNSACAVEIVSLEKEILPPRLLNAIAVPQGYGAAYALVRKAAALLLHEEGNTRISVLVGDARTTIRGITDRFGAVFFDPFSVRKNPEMWSVEFFREVAKRMKEEAILSTYSSSTPVRCGLMESGLKIAPAPGDEMKREGTLASRNGDIGSFSGKIAKRLTSSPERMPYYDPELNFAREEIVEYRRRLQKRQPSLTV